MAMKRRVEPFWWSLFGAGGVMSALFLPVLLIVFCLAVPLGWLQPDYSNLRELLSPLVVRLVLIAIIGLSYFHWAHRFRFTLEEGLQLHPYDKPIAFFCYGLAIVLAGITTYTLITF